jgi:hypothetical protein
MLFGIIHCGLKSIRFILLLNSGVFVSRLPTATFITRRSSPSWANRDSEGVFKHAGQIRDYDITKREWVLRGDTVNYMYAADLQRAVEYDLEQERMFDYGGLSSDEIIRHVSRFTANLWQIHAFCEGNTRTTAVFVIQYLRSMGFSVNNEN